MFKIAINTQNLLTFMAVVVRQIKSVIKTVVFKLIHKIIYPCPVAVIFHTHCNKQQRI